MQDGQFYKNLLDSLSDGVYFVDRQRNITYWNKAAEQLTGRQSIEVIGCKCSDNILVHTDDKGTQLCTDGCPLKSTMDDGVTREANVYMLHKSGYRVPVHLKVDPILDDEGSVVGGIEVFRDGSSNSHLQERIHELEQLALLDNLTGTGNRRFADITLSTKFDEFKRYGWTFGIIFADIDNFKSINDTFGHDVGDKVLRMVAKTIEGSIRNPDAFFRWGGEEFLIVVSNVRGKQLFEVADRVRVLVENSSFEVDGKQLKTTISVGATMATGEDNWETIIKRVDSLLYASKSAGKNCSKIDSLSLAT